MTPVGRRASAPSIQPRPGVRRPVQLREHDGHVLLAGDPLDAAHDLERPFALEFVEDELDDRGRAKRPSRSGDSLARGSPPRPGAVSRATRPIGR